MSARKIEAMHREYGKDYGYKCGDCPWCYRVQGHTKGYYKCAAYGNSNSEATDWAKSWPACGLRSKSIQGITPMIKRLQCAKRPDNEPIEGQISIFDEVKE